MPLLDEGWRTTKRGHLIDGSVSRTETSRGHFAFRELGATVHQRVQRDIAPLARGSGNSLRYSSDQFPLLNEMETI